MRKYLEGSGNDLIQVRNIAFVWLEWKKPSYVLVKTADETAKIQSPLSQIKVCNTPSRVKRLNIMKMSVASS